jgi:hypothetical protein
MDVNRFAGMVALPLLLATGPGAWALVPGGGAGRSDCLAEWRVTTRNVAPTRGSSALDCQDGDPSCDGDGEQDDVCTFNVAVCGNQGNPRLPQCTVPEGATSFRHLSKGLEAPRAESGAGCGRATPFRTSVRFTRQGRKPSRRLRLRMTATSGRMRDVNRLALRCTPAPRTCPAPDTCPPNPAGPNEPNELVLLMGGLGPDLDRGWTGRAHNLLVPGGTTLQVCLEDCNASLDPECATRILTGAGTANGTYFGPPLPILAAGVPMCLVREYAAPVFAGGTADLSTGAFAATIGLRARTFLTDAQHLCPSCRAGRCEGGANDGGACTVDVTFPGPDADAAWYELSRDCLPSEETLAGTSTLTVPLTTGRSTLVPLPGGDDGRPCVAQEGEPAGVPPRPNFCAGSCDATCTGSACAMETPDPVTGEPACIDAKGGLSQVCCAGDTTIPCFATPVERIGSAEPPSPAWPIPAYPKQSRTVAVATFCEPASGSTTIDAIVGLPGPGAISLPAIANWQTAASCDGSDGPTPAPY